MGIATAGRSEADMQNIVGMFVNMLPVKAQPIEYKTFAAFLKEVHEIVLKAYENQDYPYEELIKKMKLQRHPGRDPLIDAAFTRHDFDYEASARTMQETGDLKITPYPYEPGNSNFLLDLEFTEADEKIDLRLRYFANVFKESTVRAITQHYLEILKQIIGNINILLKDIKISSHLEGSRKDILVGIDKEFDF